MPECVDLALLIIPAEFVPEELERCGKARARAALIITSGFAEQRGDEGADLQQRLRAIASRYGMIVCGPNTEGFANLEQLLCATFSPAVDGLALPLIPAHGRGSRVAVIAQSGGMGFSFFDRGRPKDVAFNYIVTTGNEACLEVFDVVDYLVEEDLTDVFLLFIENIKTAATFRRAADRALRAGKPIIVVKIGHSDAGQRAAASHTAALAGSYEVYRAMFRHYGIIEGGDLEELVDLAAAFSHYRGRLPAGKRIGIGTASGGGGGWLADACVAAGLEIPELDPSTRSLIDRHLPSYGTSQNPVDGTAQAIRQIGYSELARLIALSERIDAVAMVVSARSAETLQRERENLNGVAAATEKPIVMWSYTNPCEESLRIVSEAGLPLVTNMRNCARVLVEMANYRSRRASYLSNAASTFMHDPERIARVRLTLLQRTLCEYQIAPLLAEYGISSAEARLAKSAEEAVAFAAAIQGAVALKVQSPNILHKTEVGAVALDVKNPAEVREQYERLLANAGCVTQGDGIHGVLVQRMAAMGVEVIVGIKRDAVFGPLLMIGLGGIHAEILQDVALSPVPVSRTEAIDLISNLRGAKLLQGARGVKPADVTALAELCVKLSLLAFELADDIDELELNPVIVHCDGSGVSIVDGLLIARNVNPILARDATHVSH